MLLDLRHVLVVYILWIFVILLILNSLVSLIISITSYPLLGCYSDDGYTHDAECVMYHGPDTQYTDHEICFNYNEDTLTIVDVTHKDAIKLIARFLTLSFT